jgi:hypothetical protein
VIIGVEVVEAVLERCRPFKARLRREVCRLQLVSSGGWERCRT